MITHWCSIHGWGESFTEGLNGGGAATTGKSGGVMGLWAAFSSASCINFVAITVPRLTRW